MTNEANAEFGMGEKLKSFLLAAILRRFFVHCQGVRFGLA
jgi:hypothetical protein